VINFEQTNRAEIGSRSTDVIMVRELDEHLSLRLANSRRPVEELGFMPLPNDKEAVAFGETVIREMVQGNLQAGTVMEVTDDERAVGGIQPDQSN